MVKESRRPCTSCCAATWGRSNSSRRSRFPENVLPCAVPFSAAESIAVAWSSPFRASTFVMRVMLPLPLPLRRPFLALPPRPPLSRGGMTLLTATLVPRYSASSTSPNVPLPTTSGGLSKCSSEVMTDHTESALLLRRSTYRHEATATATRGARTARTSPAVRRVEYLLPSPLAVAIAGSTSGGAEDVPSEYRKVPFLYLFHSPNFVS
mmetsp:Transcript_14213/g.41703  ORF Transcript_14213/g.41703 Transcript_14213/m.41703 type:complete len:208 (+) Transcript_14213:1830-2453(+)